MFKVLKQYSKSLVYSSEANFGTADLKSIKLRMKSINSIAKITKAMKMVAASKMRIDLNRLDKGKNFGVSTVKTLFNNEGYL